MCEDLEESEAESPLIGFSDWVRSVLVGEQCFDASYASRITERSNVSWNQPGTLSGSKQIIFTKYTTHLHHNFEFRTPMALHSMHPIRIIPNNR